METHPMEEKTNTSVVIGRWIPVKFSGYYMSFSDKYIKKKELNNGLWVLHPLKKQSIPPKFRLLVQPELLDSNSDDKYYKIKQQVAIARITQDKEGYIIIELLKPRIPETTPKYNLFIIAMPGKSVGSGASETSKLITEDVLFSAKTTETSRTGNHWVDYYIIVSDVNKDVEILYKYRGARSSTHKTIYTYSSTGVTETNITD